MSDKQFKVVIPGVDGGGSQVFEADSQEELADKLKTAQENATSKIRQLAQENELLRQQAEQHGGGQQQANGDGRQQFFNTLYTDPEAAIIGVLEKRMNMGFDDFQKDYQQVRTGSQKAIQNEVSAVFAQRHPELLQVSTEEDKHNADTISKILTDNGWAFNLNNLEAAYAVAKTQNQLKLHQTSQFPEATLMPAPTTISRPTGSINNSASEEEFLRTAPLPKVKEYLEKKYAGIQG
jgi:hypothetical protein